MPQSNASDALMERNLGIHIVDVNGIHPAPDIHEQFMIHKGYGTLRISSRTTSTILSAL